ncbi:MAG: hypothetical protein ABJO86_02675 [Lentilitoribacter sp.]
MNTRRQICNLISIISIFAMIWIGVAHRPVITSSMAADVELAAYALPDGSIPIICFGGEGDDKDSTLQGCPDCTIANAIIIPERSQTFAVAINEIDFIITPRRKFELAKTIKLAGTPPTGPPNLVI